MIKVLIEEGTWPGSNVEQDLRREPCPNPDCITAGVNYPTWMDRPHCPDCKTDLIGAKAKIFVGSPKRVAYHLEK